MIRRIVKFTSGKDGSYHYTVYYNRTTRDYTMHMNLPVTVVLFLLEAECETIYTETGKIERFS